MYVGKNITEKHDRLDPLDIAKIVEIIRDPPVDLRDRIVQLRAIRSFDINSYRKEKVRLPYVVCACFHPVIRGSENFVFTDSFFLDIDNISGSGRSLNDIREQLVSDPQVQLIYKSPGEDGLKVLFKLDCKCRDKALYSSFYRLFAMDFSKRHGLVGLVDVRTSDVTRACFLSFDKDAIYRDDSQPVSMESYIPGFDYNMIEESLKNEDPSFRKMNEKQQGPSEDVIRKIRAKLNPGNYREQKNKKEFFVPPEVDDKVSKIIDFLPGYNMELKETHPIQYGRKLHVTVPGTTLWAEVNLFYGKKGFSIVPTTKSGSDRELALLVKDALRLILIK